MDIAKEFNKLTSQISEYEKSDEKKEVMLPENSCFLSCDEILCKKRQWGDSRYPYMRDGLVLWAFSSGYIFLGESTFQVFPPTYEGGEPHINFYLGIKKNNEYFPYSINGTGKFAFEKGVERYCVFTPSAGYYFTKTTDDVSAMLRVFVDSEKKVYFSIYVINSGDKKQELYISSFFNPLLTFSQNATFEDKWFKESSVQNNGFLFDNSIRLSNKNVIHKYLGINTIYTGKSIDIIKTTSRADYVGDKNYSISSSENLIKGSFKGVNITKFTDTAIAGDMARFTLDSGECFRADYVLNTNDSNNVLSNITSEDIDRIKEREEKKDSNFSKELEITFSGINSPLYDKSFNYFIKNVQRQVDFCGSGRSYAYHLLGVRDLFQSIEGMLLWNKERAKAKIIEGLSFCGENGRMPRQYSLPPNKNVLPELDMREFIDQGNWIFDTLYQYLAYTNDFSLLNEITGYYKYNEDDTIDFSSLKESIFLHLKRIMGYLISCIDTNTCCLRAMYGDWNDALDGLGRTEKKGQKFGSGVSVMATLHLVKNLNEFSQICHNLKLYEDESYYMGIRNKVIDGLKKYAVVEKDGKKKILHGWGDERKYFVGSFCDCDGKSRDSLVTNAFWVISGMIDKTPELKNVILDSFNRLESKYGFLTFSPAFEEGTKGVGRIPYLPEGTAENGAAYNHASLFAVWALFIMGQDDWAWKIINKVIPLTHKEISVTPFIMNNSYVYNEKYNMDGQSMNDWHTGASNVFIKILARYVCGVRADLDGITIQPELNLPCKKLSFTANIKGKQFNVEYNHHNNIKKILINGVESAVDKNLIRIDNKEIFNTDKFMIKTY